MQYSDPTGHQGQSSTPQPPPPVDWKAAYSVALSESYRLQKLHHEGAAFDTARETIRYHQAYGQVLNALHDPRTSLEARLALHNAAYQLWGSATIARLADVGKPPAAALHGALEGAALTGGFGVRTNLGFDEALVPSSRGAPPATQSTFHAYEAPRGSVNGVRTNSASGEIDTPEPAARGAVRPGDRGTYADLKAQKSQFGETEPLDMDHQPSFAAQKAAAEQTLGRRLTPAEARALKAGTPSVASPRTVHQQTSPTFGGRNTPARVAEDAADLAAAAARDRAVFEEAMKKR